MEVAINFKDQVFKCNINKNFEVEEMNGKGYFYMNATGKIVIMNPTSFCIWKYIESNTFADKNTIIDSNDIVNKIKKCFEVSVKEEEKLIEDIHSAIINFIREDFLLLQE